jgi:hypothetical protein
MEQDTTLVPGELVENGILIEFTQGWLSDNSMMVLSIRAGEPPQASELIDLAAAAKSVFSLVILVCRQQTRIIQCAQLWEQTLAVFEKARQVWVGVEVETDLIAWYLNQLERFCELSRDRLELYQLEGQDRRRLVVRKAAEL